MKLTWLGVPSMAVTNSSDHSGTLRLIGSAGAKRAIEAEFKRLAPRALGVRIEKHLKSPNPQCLSYPFEPQLAWMAVRYIRTASRIVWDIGQYEADRLEPLYEDIFISICDQRPAWMESGLTFSVKVARSDDFAAGPMQLRGTVKNAIIDGAKHHRVNLSLDPDNPDIHFRVEAEADYVTLSIDLGGRSLHRRNIRTLVAEASLKETLAAQMLILARWDSRTEALIDPMAGAGTIGLEATAMAVGAPITRELPACAKINPFKKLFQNEIEEQIDSPPPNLFPGTEPNIASIEIHTPNYRALNDNCSRDPLAQNITTLHSDFRNITKDHLTAAMDLEQFPERGLVIVNPPYGERLETAKGYNPELEELYEDLGQWRKKLGKGWRLGILGPKHPLMAALGKQPKLEKPMKNGQIPVTFLVYE